MEEKRGLKTVTRRCGKGPRQIILDQHHQPRAFCAEETWKKSRRNFPSLPSLQPRSTPLKKINENSHLPSFVLNDITVSTAVISRTETILHLSLSLERIFLVSFASFFLLARFVGRTRFVNQRRDGWKGKRERSATAFVRRNTPLANPTRMSRTANQTFQFSTKEEGYNSSEGIRTPLNSNYTVNRPD